MFSSKEYFLDFMYVYINNNPFNSMNTELLQAIYEETCRTTI